MTDEHQPEPIHDPPIEHDDLGQALVTLPFALAKGGEEVVAWAASETIIPAAEKLIEAFRPSVEATPVNIDIEEHEETSTHVQYAAHEDAP